MAHEICLGIEWDILLVCRLYEKEREEELEEEEEEHSLGARGA